MRQAFRNAPVAPSMDATAGILVVAERRGLAEDGDSFSPALTSNRMQNLVA